MEDFINIGPKPCQKGPYFKYIGPIISNILSQSNFRFLSATLLASWFVLSQKPGRMRQVAKTGVDCASGAGLHSYGVP